ncbi:MAG: O-antigen ligase family protein, partial [Anaerolineae bacterium]
MKSDAKKRSPEASNLDGVAQALVMVAVSIPVLFNPWGANAFELPKALAIRTVAILLGVVTLANAAEKGHLGGKRLPLHVIALILLTVVLIAATLFSINPRLSLWGSYNRQQGLVTLTSYAILFLSTAYVLGNRAHIDRLWTLLVMGSVPVVTYGLLQACSLDPLEWQTDAASPVLSTLGRANFLGSYLTLIIPLTFGRILLGRHRLPLVLLLAGQGICLLLTQARGAWVGSGAGFIAGLLAWGYSKRDHRPFVAAVVTTVLVASFIVVLNLPGGPLAPLASLPGLNRLATLFQTRAGSTAARIAIWRATFPLIAHHPWLGYGPETFRLVFARVFPPQLVYYQGRGVIIDRAHNLWLDLAVNAGLPAVLALLLLIFDLGKRIRRGLHNATAPWQTVAWTALAASLTGHLVDLQFGFETVSTATVLALLMAMIVALSRTTSLE